MFGIGTTELVLLLVIVVLVFGVGKLPQVGKQLGSAIAEFKKSIKPPDESGKSEKDSEDKNV
jgi:sec-independent protein translocase protein TatA